MGSVLNPYIMFNGNAREAMEFYREVFGGELEIGTVADFGSPDSPEAEKVMHARLQTPDGSSSTPGMPLPECPITRGTTWRSTSGATTRPWAIISPNSPPVEP